MVKRLLGSDEFWLPSKCKTLWEKCCLDVNPWNPVLIAGPLNDVMYTSGYNIVTTLLQCDMYNLATTTNQFTIGSHHCPGCDMKGWCSLAVVTNEKPAYEPLLVQCTKWQTNMNVKESVLQQKLFFSNLNSRLFPDSVDTQYTVSHSFVQYQRMHTYTWLWFPLCYLKIYCHSNANE